MFRADAIQCAEYLRIRCLTHALDNKTPYEMWYGRLPLVKHLKVFGSTSYALIPKEKRCKVGARSRKCIFLGYFDTTKGYKLYDEVNNKFLFVRDLSFLE